METSLEERMMTLITITVAIATFIFVLAATESLGRAVKMAVVAVVAVNALWLFAWAIPWAVWETWGKSPEQRAAEREAKMMTIFRAIADEARRRDKVDAERRNKEEAERKKRPNYYDTQKGRAQLEEAQQRRYEEIIAESERLRAKNLRDEAEARKRHDAMSDKEKRAALDRVQPEIRVALPVESEVRKAIPIIKETK
jgi:hypothetical protein